MREPSRKKGRMYFIYNWRPLRREVQEEKRGEFF